MIEFVLPDGLKNIKASINLFKYLKEISLLHVKQLHKIQIMKLRKNINPDLNQSKLTA